VGLYLKRDADRGASAGCGSFTGTGVSIFLIDVANV
jgi:hypothetical protein